MNNEEEECGDEVFFVDDSIIEQSTAMIESKGVYTNGIAITVAGCEETVVLEYEELRSLVDYLKMERERFPEHFRASPTAARD